MNEGFEGPHSLRMDFSPLAVRVAARVRYGRLGGLAIKIALAMEGLK